MRLRPRGRERGLALEGLARVVAVERLAADVVDENVLRDAPPDVMNHLYASNQNSLVFFTVVFSTSAALVSFAFRAAILASVACTSSRERFCLVRKDCHRG